MKQGPVRHAEFSHALRQRRRAMQDDIRRRIRDGRSGGPREGRDEVDRSDAATEGDLGLALLQMSAATVARIDEALGRLDAGTFGVCIECEETISDKRLRALLFAVRCQTCEIRREEERGRPALVT